MEDAIWQKQLFHLRFDGIPNRVQCPFVLGTFKAGSEYLSVRELLIAFFPKAELLHDSNLGMVGKSDKAKEKLLPI